MANVMSRVRPLMERQETTGTLTTQQTTVCGAMVDSLCVPVPIGVNQVGLRCLAYHLPGAQRATRIGLSDVPVDLETEASRHAATAQRLRLPSMVCGRLDEDGEVDWYTVEAARGELLYFEAWAERLGAAIDIDLLLFDATGERLLHAFSDQLDNPAGATTPIATLDPYGSWVAPYDGLFRLAVRSVGGAASANCRIYAVSVHRAQADCVVLATPRAGPLNVPRGGRSVVDLLALRRRGCDGPIRVFADNVDRSFSCPEIWMGPGVTRSTMVISAEEEPESHLARLSLRAQLPRRDAQRVTPITVVREGLPTGWSRAIAELPVGVSDTAPVQITATPIATVSHHLYGELTMRYAPGSIVDVTVDVDRRDRSHTAPVRIMADAVPDGVTPSIALIPAGETVGHLSFYLSPSLAGGRYSIVIRAETSAPVQDRVADITTYSNPVTFEVKPAAFLVKVDPFAPQQIRRGETIQVKYSVQRRNGFIGKLHTELAIPGCITDVPGIRGRGETFVGQTDHGTLQIVANDDAATGRPPFLRLFTVGVVEDQPVYHGAYFLDLRVVD